MKIAKLTLIALIFVLSACATQKAESPEKVSTAGGSGDSFFTIHTDDTEVQRLFERGVVLTYGFNHQEAHNTYMQAAA